MAYTTEQITALENAIAQGALKVKYADKEVTYRSLSEMQQILNTMKAQSGQVKKSDSRLFATFTKGT